jgi:hypothetical protein
MTLLITIIACLYAADKLFNPNIEKTENGWYLFYGQEYRNYIKLWR